MWDLAVVALVAIAQVEITEKRVVEEALEHDILVAGSACVVDTSEAVRPTRGCCSIRGDVTRIVLDGFGKELIVFSLAAGWYKLARLHQAIQSGPKCT